MIIAHHSSSQVGKPLFLRLSALTIHCLKNH
jgi:hypothetical protein